MFDDIPHAFRLAVRGGPEACTARGLTLALSTEWVDTALERMFDIELLIASQVSFLERAKKFYNAKTILAEEELLKSLIYIKTLKSMEQKHALLELMIKKDL